MIEEQARQGSAGQGPGAGSASGLDMVIGWSRVPTGEAVVEEAMPDQLRAALASLREEDAAADYLVLAWRTLLDGAEVARTGPAGELPADSGLLALSLVESRVALDGIGVSAQMAVLLKTVH